MGPPRSPAASHQDWASLLCHEQRALVNARSSTSCEVAAPGACCRNAYDFPPWSTVYHHVRKWRDDGVWTEVMHALRRQERQRRSDRAPEPSAVIPRQPVGSRRPKKGAQWGSTAGGKRVTGRKNRHLLVDTQGSGARWCIRPISRIATGPIWCWLKRWPRRRGCSRCGPTRPIGGRLPAGTAAWGWTIAIGQRAPDNGRLTVALQPRRWVVVFTSTYSKVVGRNRRSSKDYEVYPAAPH